MTFEARSAPEDCLGSLRSCLVEGDPQCERGARRTKQRALVVSIVLETLALTALVLFPLLSKGERLSLRYATPIPPYVSLGGRGPAVRPHHGPQIREGRIWAPTRISPTVPNRDTVNSTNDGESPEGEPIPGLPASPGVAGGIRATTTQAPIPPPQEARTPSKPRFVSEGVQMAKLITRVEPIYPLLATQIHREGRVELHATISTDGTVESLEVLSGDPFFFKSALSAVRQWRYRPTILNGTPIEIDTHITVIYTLNH